MKTVLVTGAGGLIGRTLTQGLQADGHRVVPLPRFGGEVPAGVAGWNPAAGVCALPADLNPQVVIHLAGKTPVACVGPSPRNGASSKVASTVRARWWRPCWRGRSRRSWC